MIRPLSQTLLLLTLALSACGGDGGSGGPATLVIATPSLANGQVGTPVSDLLAATGGTPPYRWAVASGALPAGITLSASGLLTGTPTVVGTSTLGMEVADSGQPEQNAQKIYAWAVLAATLEIATTTLPAATENLAFSQTLNATGGVGSYTWSLQSGTLPAGITFSSGGVLAGIPTAPGIATFVVGVSDGGTPTAVASQTYNLVVAATGAAVQVTLAAKPSTITIGGNFAGLSYEKNAMYEALFGPDDTSLIALFNRLGPGLLRIGGNSVDATLWSATGAGETAGQVSPSDVARLAGFLQATHWKVLYGIEFLNEAASPVAPTDPALVAAEAVNVMQTLGDSLYAFEIGNEPDIYENKVSNFTYADFQAQWETYQSAILSAVAAAKDAGKLPQGANPIFTGPAAAFNDTGYMAPFAAAEAQRISLLTRHYYIANGQSPTSTMTLMLMPDPNLAPMLSFMASMSASNDIPSGYRISECNSFYNGGAPGVSDGFGSSLWVINYLFTNAWAGSTGANFHGGGNGPGYTPIADNHSAVVEARPEYYGIYLFSQAANGALVATTMTPATNSLYAYAVAAAGGATEVMLVNTSATVANNVSIQFNGTVSRAKLVTLTGPSLVSTTGQLLNGAMIAADGSWTPLVPPSLPIVTGLLNIPVAAGSAILVTAQ